jgi:hypothetical protein
VKEIENHSSLLEPHTRTNIDQNIMAGPSISQSNHKIISVTFLLYSILIGRFIATQPSSEWSFFSWHPFLMTSGFVGLMGVAAVTKKLGGYANTKYHGYLSSAGLMLAFGGISVIYKNKDIHNKPHFTSTHAWMGIATMVCAFLPAIAGLVFLHPDFGAAKTNKLYRFVHKWIARSAIVAAYVTGYWGLSQMTQDPWVLASYAIPLLTLAPFTLI